jgi:transposase
MGLVQQRTALMLSFKSLYTRTTGQAMPLSELKAMEMKKVRKLYEHPANQLIAVVQKQHIEQLTESIEKLETVILKSARELPYFEKLKTLPGVGLILGQTITLEVGDISRFGSPGQFASYCRAVDARHLSNGKKKAENNQKCGNKYLAWAFVEAANFARRSDEKCRRWFDRKAAKTNNVIATKALACKLAKAAWHVMSNQVDYDEARVFPELAARKPTVL